MKRDKKTVLFFVKAGIMTPELYEAVRNIEKNAADDVVVRIRNGSVDDNSAVVERADYVAGNAVPQEYANVYPTISDDGSVGETPFSGQPAATDAAPTGEVPQAGAQDQTLAQEIGSVGGNGWGATPPQTPNA